MKPKIKKTKANYQMSCVCGNGCNTILVLDKKPMEDVGGWGLRLRKQEAEAVNVVSILLPPELAEIVKDWIEKNKNP